MYTQEAIELLGNLIQINRKEKKMTLDTLSERAGISRGTLHKIEHGNLHCEIGIVFEVARILGIQLFNMDKKSLSHELFYSKEKITLLPSRQRQRKNEIDDAF